MTPPPLLKLPPTLLSSFPHLLLFLSSFAAISFLLRRRHPSAAMTHRPSPLSFPSPESLSDYLSPRLPPSSLSLWGSAPGTKTLHNLFLELSQGETTLLSPSGPSPPIRTVHVATVRVRNPRGALLVESHQLLSDGSLRPRGRPLSEKMRPGESVEDAAIRAVREELGGSGIVARVLPGSYEMREEERGSASYPGLPARYVIHAVEAVVEGIPEEGEFATEEGGEEVEMAAAEEEGKKAVFVKRHFWKWVDDYDGIVR